VEIEMAEGSGAADEAEIRSLVNGWVEALRTKDVDALMSTYAPEVVSFDVVNPLRRIGSDAARRRAEEWFATFEGPIGYEVRDLDVSTAGDVAFSHHLYRVSGALKDGRKLGMWVRATMGYRKVEGSWLVTHAHNSVPLDAESGQASLDLEP
jgi:uncharacterized protein (TIGR02246 family)